MKDRKLGVYHTPAFPDISFNEFRDEINLRINRPETITHMHMQM